MAYEPNRYSYMFDTCKSRLGLQQTPLRLILIPFIVHRWRYNLEYLHFLNGKWSVMSKPTNYVLRVSQSTSSCLLATYYSNSGLFLPSCKLVTRILTFKELKMHALFIFSPHSLLCL